MHRLVRDLRYAFRNLLRSPGFSFVTLLTLALGIGANTAMFSVVESVLLRPLPFAEPERLVSLWEFQPDDDGRLNKSRVTAANYFDWKEQSESLEEMALFGSASFNWTGAGEPEQLLGARVTASYFRVLGIDPILGRAFLEEETGASPARGIVLSHGLWLRRFGGARDVIGRTMTLDGNSYEVIGVMPPGVYPTWPQATGRIPFLPMYQQIWVPMPLSEQLRENRRSHLFGVLARLRDGTTMAEARAEMETIAARLAETHPDSNAGETILLVSYLDEVVGGARPALFILLAAVGLVLLIACANIGGILLARAADRGREVALRAALGANRSVLVQQFLCESLLLSLVAGVLGLAVARLGIAALLYFSPEEIPRLAEASLNPTVVVFALAVAVATSTLFGLAPALKGSLPELQSQLKEGGRQTRAMGSGGRFGLRRLFVVAETAMAVVLVVSAGLLIQSFWRLRQVDVGFRSDNVLVADIVLPRIGYEGWPSIRQFHGSLLERFRALPTVEAASIAYDHPLQSNWIDSFGILGAEATTGESLAATFRIVGVDYFRTMGIDVVRGRPFNELDDPSHPGAVIVNEAFAHRYLPDGETLGRRLTTSTPSAVWGEPIPSEFEIVGIVRDVKFLGPATASEPAFYVPAGQFPLPDMSVVIRSQSDALALAPRLREEVWSLDPNLPIASITTMERLLEEARAQPRFNSFVLGVFGTVALALAAMGIYGLLAYSVSSRTNEIGIRMALGARAEDVVGMVVRQSSALTLSGLALGLVASFALTRLLSSLLFEVSATDPATFGLVALFLGLVAALASYLPAKRATRVQPIEALRYE